MELVTEHFASLFERFLVMYIRKLRSLRAIEFTACIGIAIQRLDFNALTLQFAFILDINSKSPINWTGS